MTDELTPKGSRRAFNPISHVKRTCALVDGDASFSYYPGAAYDCNLHVSGFKVLLNECPAGIPTGDWVSLMSSLADQLDGRIDEGTLALVSLAELKNTVQMIRNPFNLLKADWRKRAEKHSASTLMKRGANVWLEHRYGWLSFKNDIESLAKTLGRVFSEQSTDVLAGWWTRYTASEQVPVSSQTLYPTGFGESWWSQCMANIVTNGLIPASRIITDSSTVTYTLGCRALMDATQRWSKTRRFLNAFGLDAPSIAATCWELVPFSFVIDWFVDPQGLLYPATLQRLLGHNLRDLGYSKKFDCTYRADLCWGTNPFEYVYSPYQRWTYKTCSTRSGFFMSGSSKGRYSLYERNIGTPAFSVLHSAFLQKGLSLTQSISGISLIIQRMLTGKAR